MKGTLAGNGLNTYGRSGILQVRSRMARLFALKNFPPNSSTSFHPNRVPNEPPAVRAFVRPATGLTTSAKDAAHEINLP